MGMVVAMSMSVLVAVVMAVIMIMIMIVIVPGGMSMPAVILPLIVGAVVALIVGVSGVVLRVVRHGRQLNGTGSPGERAAPAMLADCERVRSR